MLGNAHNILSGFIQLCGMFFSISMSPKVLGVIRC